LNSQVKHIFEIRTTLGLYYTATISIKKNARINNPAASCRVWSKY